jgi:hypothetical protein
MQIPTPSSGKSPLIFDHQQSAFQKLRRAGNVCFSPLRSNLPMQPRTNSLLIGPSGSGKSYLARAVAESFGFECKALTVAEWMLLGSGSKGAQRTWNAIFDFLLKNHSKKGAVIFLDEVDKLTGSSDWVQHLRVEVFRLLDLSVPPDLIDGDDNRHSRTTFNEVEEFLKRRTFIIAAGAFQSIWDEGGKQIGGFGGERPTESPSQELLSRHLARELINRFRSDVVILEPLGVADYESMLLSSAEKMPRHLQEQFLLMGEQRIACAINNKQGVRFLEELVADVLAEECPEPTTQPTLKNETPSRWRLGSPQTRAPGFW